MMGQVPEAYVENYARALNLLTDDMRNRLAADLAKIDLSDVAAGRAAAIALMERYCGPYTDYAAVIAAEFFDGLVERMTGRRPGALADGGWDSDATAGAVHAIMKAVVKGQPRETWEALLLQRADKEVRNAADRCIAGNAGSQGVRWARVPIHADPCDFCVMLAGRGAVYGSEADASAGHANCDCRAVPDFGEGIEGYDPDEWYRAWRKIEEVKRRDDLSSSEKKMLRMAAKDSVIPLGLLGSRELADRFDACMNARADKFLRDKPDLSETVYDETVGALLADIGDMYDMELSGEFACGPKLRSAIPDGDEIWAVTRMRHRLRTVRFLGIDRRRRRGNPDLLAEGKYIDIKTPRNPERIGKSLTYASTQCRNRGQEAGIALLSPLRLHERPQECIHTAENWIERGTISKVYVIGLDSSVTEA